jgi:putative redox protein
MKVQLKWNYDMKFESASEGNSVEMDAKSPIGSGSAMTPKELVAAGLGGCTAMDVAALLKKHKQTYKSFKVDVDVQTSTSGQPAVFTGALLTFSIEGEVNSDVLIEAVKLSQTKYCGVSAMLVKAFPIAYVILLNDVKIGEGKADFVGTNG